MKKLYLLSILFIVSCATSNSYYNLPDNTELTILERASVCQSENINKYFGDCWMQKSLDDKNFLEWVSTLNMWESWRLIKQLNQDLKFKVALGELNTMRANYLFRQALVEID